MNAEAPEAMQTLQASRTSDCMEGKLKLEASRRVLAGGGEKQRTDHSTRDAVARARTPLMLRGLVKERCIRLEDVEASCRRTRATNPHPTLDAARIVPGSLVETCRRHGVIALLWYY